MSSRIRGSEARQCLLFSARMRCLLLRATLVSCIIASMSFFLLIPLDYFGDFWVWMFPIMPLPVFGGTALLQLLSAFRLKYILGLVDLVLICVQLGALIVFDVYFTRDALLAGTALEIAGLIVAYSITILLILQCTCRMAAVFLTKGQNLWMPFDIQLGTPLMQRRRTTDILVGAFVWRRLFKRESNIIRILRGCFAIALLAIFIAFAYTNVVAYPLSEVGLGVRVKTFRTTDLDENISSQLLSSSWNVFVTVNWDPVYALTMPGLPVDTDSTEFKDAVQVLPLYHNRTGPTCESIDGNAYTPYILYPLGPSWTFKVMCPVLDPDEFSPQPIGYFNEYTPDLFVAINFTTLGIPSTSSTDQSHLVKESSWNSVSIVAGLSNCTTDVIADSQAVTVIPNEHLISGVDVHVRQRFAEAIAATLGLTTLSKMRTFLVADLVGIRPNPSTAIPRDSDIGSLYLYRQPHLGDWTIVTDYREDSVLSGLSQVGGFWTLVNGLLAFLFGSQLMRIFFGVKPLSTFGLVHSFSQVDLDDSYPHILSEGDLPEAQRSMVAFVRDHLVDLDSVKKFGDVESGGGECDVEMEEQTLISSPAGKASSSRDSLSSTQSTLNHPDSMV